MINSVFGRALWERKISILATSTGMFVFALLFAALHESFAGEIAMIADSFPPEFSAVLGDITAAAKPEGFLNLELYSLFLPFTVAITGIIFGAKAIGKEEDSGTLELLLASPISRRKILMQKLSAIKLTLLIVSFSSWLGVLVGKALFVFDANLANVASASLAVFLLGMAYAMASLAGQSITGKTRVGLGLGTGLLVLTYFADILSKLVDSLVNLKYISPFHYMDVTTFLNGDGDAINYVILLSISLVLYLFAHVGFMRRDTGV